VTQTLRLIATSISDYCMTTLMKLDALRLTPDAPEY